MVSRNTTVVSGLGVLLLFVALWFSYVGPSSIMGAFTGFTSDTSGMECYPLFDLHPETVAYIDRVVSDGGTVIDMNWTDAVIRQSIADGWFDDIWIFVDANMGVRLSSDGSDTYDKLYSIHGSGNDAIASGNSRPLSGSVDDKRVIRFSPDRDTFFATQVSDTQHFGGDITYLGGLITEETYQAILGHSSGNSRGFANRGHLSQFRFRSSQATMGNPTTHVGYDSDTYSLGDRHIFANRWDADHIRHFYLNNDYIGGRLGDGFAWVNRLGTWGDGRARGDYFMFSRVLDYLEDDAYTNLITLYNTYYGLAGNDGAPSSGSPIQDPDWNVLICIEEEEQDDQCDFDCVEDIDDAGSALDLHPETIAYMERVMSDGGTIVDLNWTDTLIRQSIIDGWFNDIWIFVDANMGVRLSSDGSDTYDKLYSIHGSGNDAVASGNSRPLSGYTDDKRVIRFSPDRDTFFATQVSDTQHFGGDITYLGGLITEQTYQALLGHSSGNSRGFAHRGNLDQFRFRTSQARTGDATTHVGYDSSTYSFGDRHILANRWDDGNVRHFYINDEYLAGRLGDGFAWVNRLGTWGDGRARGDYFMFARILDYLDDDAYDNLISLYDRYYGLAGNEGSSISLSLLPPSESTEPPEVPKKIDEDWYDSSWSQRYAITTNSDYVSSSVDVLYYDLSLLPASFWDTVNSDGSDIRVTKSDGVSEVALEVVHIDVDAQTGALFFDSTGVSTSEKTTWYIYYDNLNAQAYSSSHQFGAHNVWGNSFKGVWHLDEMSESSAFDSSVHSNDGVYRGSLPTTTSGLVSFAQQFNRNNRDYVEIPSSSSLDLTSQITISAWIRISSFSENWEHIVGKGDSTYQLRRNSASGGNSNALIFNLRSGDGDGTITAQVEGTTAVNTDTWHFVHATYDGSQMCLYIDGSRDNCESVSGTIGTTSSGLQIGANYDDSSEYRRYFGGSIGSVFIRDIGVSQSDVQTEFYNQKHSSIFWGYEDSDDVITSLTDPTQPYVPPLYVPPPNYDEMISLLEFGAVGDGVTDNTQAFTDAIEYAGQHNVPLFIPEGVFLLDTNVISIPYPIEFVGAGSDKSIITSNMGSTRLDVRTSKTSFRDLGFERMVEPIILGSRSGYVLRDILFERVRFENVEARDRNRGIIGLRSGSSGDRIHPIFNLTVRDSQFIDVKGTGAINIRGYITHSNIIDNTFKNVINSYTGSAAALRGSYAIRLGENADDAGLLDEFEFQGRHRIEGNHIDTVVKYTDSGNLKGILLYGDYSTIKNNIIENIDGTPVGDDAGFIYIRGAFNEVSHNIFRNAIGNDDDGAVTFKGGLTLGSQYNVIHSNLIENVQGLSGVEVSTSHLHFYNNTVINAHPRGLQHRAGTGLIIEGNTFKNADINLRNQYGESIIKDNLFQDVTFLLDERNAFPAQRDAIRFINNRFEQTTASHLPRIRFGNNVEDLFISFQDNLFISLDNKISSRGLIDLVANGVVREVEVINNHAELNSLDGSIAVSQAYRISTSNRVVSGNTFAFGSQNVPDSDHGAER